MAQGRSSFDKLGSSHFPIFGEEDHDYGSQSIDPGNIHETHVYEEHRKSIDRLISTSK